MVKENSHAYRDLVKLEKMVMLGKGNSHRVVVKLEKMMKLGKVGSHVKLE